MKLSIRSQHFSPVIFFSLLNRCFWWGWPIAPWPWLLPNWFYINAICCGHKTTRTAQGVPATVLVPGPSRAPRWRWKPGCRLLPGPRRRMRSRFWPWVPLSPSFLHSPPRSCSQWSSIHLLLWKWESREPVLPLAQRLRAKETWNWSCCSQASPSRPCPGTLGRNCKTMRFFTEQEGLPCFGVQYTKLCWGHTALGMVFVKIGLILSNMIFCVKTPSLISAIWKHKTITSTWPWEIILNLCMYLLNSGLQCALKPRPCIGFLLLQHVQYVEAFSHCKSFEGKLCDLYMLANEINGTNLTKHIFITRWAWMKETVEQEHNHSFRQPGSPHVLPLNIAQ